MRSAKDIKAAKLRPREDWGFFGPGSPTWKVWTSPTALIGFQRAVVLEHFDPFLAAAVADSAGIYTNPLGRFDRTLDYFLTVAVADARTAVAASEMLMKVHAKVTGVEPISGRPYSANDPDSQLWIHITGWHSVLLCYERYGPGPLSETDERRFWADCVVAAELQTCDPEDVPRSRQEVRDYYAAVRPRLATSERANAAMRYLLRTPRENSDARLWAGSRLMAPAAIATLPKWMRRLGGYDQPAVLDAAIRYPTRIAVWTAAASPYVRRAVLGTLAPRTGATYEHWLSGDPPRRDETVTPAQAFAGRADPVVGAERVPA
jgi:uncharacterized protein (DUF2236 family)